MNLIETEKKWCLPGTGLGGQKWLKVVKGYKTSVLRWVISGDVMHSMVTIVKNAVVYIWKLIRE